MGETTVCLFADENDPADRGNGWSDGIRCTQVEELAQIGSTYNSFLLRGEKAEYMSTDAGRWGEDILGLCGHSLIVLVF